MAAAKGEEDKDAHHDELVQAAGGVFVPLVVESLGLWSAASRPVLQDIALRTTTRSGISRGLAYRGFTLFTTFHNPYVILSSKTSRLLTVVVALSLRL